MRTTKIAGDNNGTTIRISSFIPCYPAARIVAVREKVVAIVKLN